ncbi:MAG TPA: polyprenyl synthetase family protein [Verrucomicrobiae bacterium]|jgi:geranylgeranyl pyrophosphate synthase|nr:polyprenyl synthetase family protein [Verrucomicrobiae bacterium]
MAKSTPQTDANRSPQSTPDTPQVHNAGDHNLAAVIEAVETCIQHSLARQAQAASQIDASYADLLNQITRLVGRGGKRLRPQLVVKAYEAYGGNEQSAIIKVAASQELYHAFILMHDDIIDRDTIRWGGPNITGHYLPAFSRRLSSSEARHYADSWALLAGDVCFNLSNEILLDSGFPPGQLLKAMRLVQRTLFTMIGGELLDVALPMYHPAETAIDDEQLLRVCATKTASYSFCTPLRLGALLANADGRQDRQLDAFGKHIGIAFQLRDDILGIFGDEQQLGKSTLSDIQGNKRTLLMNYTLRSATPRQKQQLRHILGNPTDSQDNLQTVQDIVRTTGALEKTEAVLQQYCRQAHHILLAADFPTALNNYLADLPAFCADRSY